jgi:hypothetical protein
MGGGRGTLRRLAAAAIVTGLALVVLASVAGANEGTGGGDVGVTATSVPGGAEVIWDGNGVTNGVCNTTTTDLLTPIPDNTTGWLFVLNQVSTNTGWTMQATFDVGGTVDGTVAQTQANIVKFAVYAPIGAKLQSAVAFGPVDATAGQFTVPLWERDRDDDHDGGADHDDDGGADHDHDGRADYDDDAGVAHHGDERDDDYHGARHDSVDPGPTAGAAEASQGLPRTGGGMSLPLLFAGIGLILGGGILLIAARRTAGSTL